MPCHSRRAGSCAPLPLPLPRTGRPRRSPRGRCSVHGEEEAREALLRRDTRPLSIARGRQKLRSSPAPCIQNPNPNPAAAMGLFLPGHPRACSPPATAPRGCGLPLWSAARGRGKGAPAPKGCGCQSGSGGGARSCGSAPLPSPVAGLSTVQLSNFSPPRPQPQPWRWGPRAGCGRCP